MQFLAATRNTEVHQDQQQELSINENIRFKEVRTIGSDGSQLGIMPVAKALEAAYAGRS